MRRLLNIGALLFLAPFVGIGLGGALWIFADLLASVPKNTEVLIAGICPENYLQCKKVARITPQILIVLALLSGTTGILYQMYLSFEKRLPQK